MIVTKKCKEANQQNLQMTLSKLLIIQLRFISNTNLKSKQCLDIHNTVLKDIRASVKMPWLN